MANIGDIKTAQFHPDTQRKRLYFSTVRLDPHALVVAASPPLSQTAWALLRALVANLHLLGGSLRISWAPSTRGAETSCGATAWLLNLSMPSPRRAGTWHL